jgi:hypothetical protein
MRKVDAGAETRRTMQEKFTLSLPRPLCPCGTPVFVGDRRCTMRGCDREYPSHLLQLASVYALAQGLLGPRGEVDSGTRQIALGHLGGVPRLTYETLMTRMGVERYGSHWRWKTDTSGPLIPGEHCQKSDLTYAYPKHAHP